MNTQLILSSEAFLAFGYETELRVTGTGVLGFAAAPSVSAALAGVGTVALPAAPSQTMALSGSGALAMAGAPAPNLALNGTGTLGFTAAAGFVPSGMTKSGSAQTLTTSYAVITGWTADTANYPGSTLSGNGVVAQGAKTNATLTANLALSGGFSWTVTARLLVNGSVVATGSGTSSTPATVSTTHNINNGDVVTVEAIFSGVSAPAVQTGSGTYVRIT
ncbi:hypothetical protein [Nocardia asiatica]|uniref:hypothetical protein n=1 Tax=Nocardia asiatica TaxID=209252 RepID=UPI00245741A7|nr:hypothetical protein [Nocardia asiatica]